MVIRDARAALEWTTTAVVDDATGDARGEARGGLTMGDARDRARAD